MKSSINIFLALAMICTVVGCGGSSIVPVTGTITMDGKPASGIEVFFTPLGGEGNPNPGPYSSGITDASGKFELQTRYGDPGAVVGEHEISFQYAGVDEEALDALGDAVREEMDEGNAGAAAEAKKAFDAEKAAMKNRRMPNRYTNGVSKMVEEVPSGGTDSIKYELTSGSDK